MVQIEFENFAGRQPKLIATVRHSDQRGVFSETYNKNALFEAGIDACFVQDNHSLSTKESIVRGLHFQLNPKAQAKLLRVLRGAILDVVVDIRSGSPTFGHYASQCISAENWDQVWVPVGYAHGFCTLEPNTEVAYKVTKYYDASFERGVLWNDPGLAIDWPAQEAEVILSDKDRAWPPLRDAQKYFDFVDCG